jgi:DNA-binding SARP family transcriptional activator
LLLALASSRGVGVSCFRVLGPVEAWSDERRLTLGGPRQVTLLAFLLLHANRALSADTIIDALWGAQRDGAAHRLQMAVLRLRRALEPLDEPDAPRLRTVSGGYLLAVGPDELDAEVFAERVREGRRALEQDDPTRASEVLDGALRLWRGPPLAEVAFEDFAQAEIRRLEELRLVALESRIDADLQRGRHAELIAELDGLLAQQPTRERIAGQLMVALYGAGRQAEALEVYQRTRTRLSEDLGLEPGPALKTIQTQILSHDAALKPADVPRVDAAVVTVSPEAPPTRRKVVTAVCCDLISSTPLGEELDPEALQAVVNRYLPEVREVFERRGGSVERATGEGVSAVFGIPRVREDDALRAVRAVAELRKRLPAVAEDAGVSLSFRGAVNTGLVLVSEDENLAIGDATTVAARLEQAAAPGDVLLGAETARLVRDAVKIEALEPLTLMGKSEPVKAFRLIGVDPSAPAIRRRFDRPLVDRKRELGALQTAWEQTLDDSDCHLFTLLGTAGVGKSRLVSELFASVADRAEVLSGRCLPYGEGITFWPLIEALTPLGERSQDVLDRLVTGGAATPEELFIDVRRWLESVALVRPVILHVDDLQWAEPTLLDLLDHIADLSRGAPILVLCTARPELLDEHTAWGGGKLHATAALLEPLAATDCESLLDHLGDGLAPDKRATVIATCDGNPLFLEEIVALTRERDLVAIPSTIQALLAARIERLPAEERRVLEYGAIEGEIFHAAAVTALADAAPAPHVESGLAALVRKELIRPEREALAGGEAFRFRHLLIRDAEYDGLPKATRAQLHERFASWLEHEPREVAELDEIAGWHLEQAVRYQRELVPRSADDLARRAAEHLHAGGRRAADRGDTSAARNLLDRAHVLAAGDPAARARIGVDLAEQLIEGDDLGRVDALLEAAEREPSVEASAAPVRLQWLASARPRDAVKAIDGALPGTLERLSRAGDERGLARAHMAAVSVHWMACRATSAAEHARLAAEHAGRAGNAGLRARAVGWYLWTLTKSPASAAAIAGELDATQRSETGAYLEAFMEFVRAELARLDGRFDDSRRLNERAIELFRVMGIDVLAAACCQGSAEAELSAGDPVRARSWLLRADAGLAEVGENGYRSTVQALLARVHELLGDTEAARAAIALSDELSPPEDRVNYAITHAVRARLALSDGMAEAAERWGRSAVEQAFLTDLILYQARAQLELAGILAAIGRGRDALAAARAAHRLYEAKGDRPGAAEAALLVGRL